MAISQKNDSQTTQATLNCSESVITNYNDMDCNYINWL